MQIFLDSNFTLQIEISVSLQLTALSIGGINT